MDNRGLIALLYVVAFAMSVVPLITGLLAAKSKTASQRNVQPGTIADFNQVFSPDNRRAERDGAPRRASWQLLLVGGGVATGSVASILSLYVL